MGKGRKRRADRRAVGALRFLRSRQRAAADHRAAADPEEGGLGRDRLRGEQPAGAGRLGALRRRRLRARAASSASSAIRTTGAGPADQPGLEQLRHRSATSISSTPACCSRRSPPASCRFSRGEPGALGGGLRLPHGEVGRRAAGGDPARPALGDGGLRLQHPPPDLRGLAGARRADARLQLRVRQPDPERRRAAAAGELLRQFDARDGRGAGRRAGAGAARSVRGSLVPGALDAYALPASDGSPRNRSNMRAAAKLLEEAGWTSQEGVLRNAAGEPFRFTILLQRGRTRRSPTSSSTPCASSGSRPRVELVDAAQYNARRVRLRLRHDRQRLEHVAVARQRAAALLGARRGDRRRGRATTWGWTARRPRR